VGGDQRQDNSLMPLEGGLVLGHQAAIPGDIRHQDGSKPALDLRLVHDALLLPRVYPRLPQGATIVP